MIDAKSNPAGHEVGDGSPALPSYLATMSASFSHVPSLDGMRAISIILVLLAHLINERYFPGGLGVLIFFVISGFLITRLLLAEFKETGKTNLLNFYLRRVFRLYPAIIVFSVVVSLAFLVFSPSRFRLEEPLSALFYFANYLAAARELHGPHLTMPFGIFWSLSVEEQYYAVFPVLFLWARTNARRLIWLAVAACVLPLAIRFGYAIAWPELLDPGKHFIYFHTETRIDSIAFGVIIAAACELERGRSVILSLTKPLPVLIAALTILGCLLYRDAFFRETIRYTLLGGSVAVLMCAVIFTARYSFANRFLSSSLAVWIGQLSYSLYVWHLATSQLAHHAARAWPVPAQTLLALALIFAVASLSYYGPETFARNARTALRLR